ncbi:glycosyl transferase [Caulobacter vibrioides]|uniref:Peptide O-xylosyltransferase n=1 Tax=Caulobacter vibrioides TaxID=155892 RepID=A0A290MRS1_CAUVI|nr:beta-1,6-N-acetylglucosaminyltransferase [Caulobacter vibrioides]ATC31035.1 glycosyl transferase [Caulobacter vibrioides]
MSRPPAIDTRPASGPPAVPAQGSGDVIAYLVLVHRYPAQFKRLFRAIHDPDNYYLVHVDKNSGPALQAEIRDFLAAYPNAAVLESKKALWGGYSLVDAELRGMETLLEMGQNWDFFINLSGQDFPLMTQKRIRAFLAENHGREFIRVLDQARMRPDTMGRVLQHVVELKDRIVDTLATRLFLDGATPYIGTQWKIVSRAFCDFVCHDPSVDRYKAFYRNTFIADEGFFQTVMMNTDVHGEIINDDKRLIDWIPDGDIKLRPRTFVAADAAQLTASADLFARKFDLQEDGEIFDLLEAHLRTQDAANAAAAPEVIGKRLLQEA